MVQNAAKRWCITVNNWTNEEYQDLIASASTLWAYLIVAKEIGENGTPHLQCFGILNNKRRLRQVKQLPGLSRAHLEISRGTTKEASDYCKKDGDYEEFGEAPKSQGARNDFERFREWVLSLDERPTESEIFLEFPSLFGRYRENLKRIVDLIIPPPSLVPENAVLKQWQQRLDDLVRPNGELAINHRKVFVVVDEQGNSGKSFMASWWLADMDIKTQLLMVGRRDDIAHAIDPEAQLFVFDVPRGELQFFQWSIVEQLKNGKVFSPKYCSSLKHLRHGNGLPVVIFTNEEPDRSKLSSDRWSVMRLRTFN